MSDAPTPRRRKGDPAPDPAQLMAQEERKVRIAMQYAVGFIGLGFVLGFLVRGLLC